MKRETLRFPAVSFCNMNAVKKSQMKLINELKLYEHIMDIPDESDSNEYFNDDEMFDPMGNQMNNENNNAEINNTDFYYYHDYFNFF